jgi:hypothetical protein
MGAGTISIVLVSLEEYHATYMHIYNVTDSDYSFAKCEMRIIDLAKIKNRGPVSLPHTTTLKAMRVMRAT